MNKLSTMKDYLDLALRDAGVIELRHHDGQFWRTGWFDNTDALLDAANERAELGNLYTSINAPKPRVVSNEMTGSPVTDKDIGWYVRLVMDFDPERPTGTPSSEIELNAACESRDRFVSAMRALDWPIPLHAKSGNGYHAMFRTRLPANAEVKEQLRVIYSGLHGDFNTPEVSFDRTVRNPGRIIRLYGSVNRKGNASPERPHRQSTVWIPREWRQVTQWQIDRLANAYAKAVETRYQPISRERQSIGGKGDYTSLDVVSWFQAHGLYLRPLEDNKHAVVCPWQSDHTTASPQHGGDTIVYSANADWPGFYCHHSHCEGRNIRSVISLFGDADQYCSTEWRVSK